MFIVDCVFRFRKRQDKGVPGLSNQARTLRKNKNLVSMKFNMSNWLLETASLILVTIGHYLENSYNITFYSFTFYTLYILVNSCGTPLVYFLGIEENRRLAGEKFQSRIRIFKKKRVSPTLPVPPSTPPPPPPPTPRTPAPTP